MRGRATQLPGGGPPPPWTPTETVLTRSEVVKFRVTPRLKALLNSVADRSEISLSDLLRGVAGHVVEGKRLDATVRADMLTVRLAANAVLSWAENAGLDANHVRELVDAGERLRHVAARHLKPAA